MACVTVIIATGCGTGNDELAQAFLGAGCTAHIAPTGGPYGNSVVLVLIMLFAVTPSWAPQEYEVDSYKRAYNPYVR